MQSKKRKNPYPDRRKVEPRPRVEESRQIPPNLSFSFTTAKKHSEFLDPEDPFYDLNQDLIETEETAELLLEPGHTLSFLSRDVNITSLANWLRERYDKNDSWINLEESKDDGLETRNDEEEIPEREVVCKTRSAAIELWRQKFTHKAICHSLKIKPCTLKKWIQRSNKGKLPMYKDQIRTKKLDQSYLDEIEHFMQNPKRICTSLMEIRRHLLKTFPEGPGMSLASVHRLLKRCGFSRKRLRPGVKGRNDKDQIQLRFVKSVDVALFLKANKKIIFLDETGFNQSMVPIYGYSKIGKRAYFKTRPQEENYSVVAAISENKLMGFMIFQGSVQHSEFGFFLIKLFKKYPDIIDHPGEYVLFMDNASSHRAINLLPLVDSFHKHMNAGYSPFLNPIEEVFGLWKHYYRKLNLEGKKSVEELVCLSAKNLTTEKVASYFLHAIKYTHQCLLKEILD